MTRKRAPARSSLHPRDSLAHLRAGGLAASLAALGRFDAAVCLAPLPAVLPLLLDLAKLGVRRLLAFGTTSRFSKHASADLAEQDNMRQFIAAEAELPS